MTWSYALTSYAFDKLCFDFVIIINNNWTGHPRWLPSHETQVTQFGTKCWSSRPQAKTYLVTYDLHEYLYYYKCALRTNLKTLLVVSNTMNIQIIQSDSTVTGVNRVVTVISHVGNSFV